ncbi:hypothetical protein LCGC14_0965660 [marine sediment metagenome]|uniref:Metallo-beta-lactamase domain-containing protein n=1 Tax=marine sediment metagenome TaxID=412755 RepID=A0A0F9RJQ3_9ZZZZ
MVTETTARKLLWPADTEVLVRVAFLYVGQGTSTVVLVADGDDYRVLLIDINLDEERGGINVPSLISDLVGNGDLAAFVNSHPHNDHLRGLDDLSDRVNILEVWHSGHKPSKKYGEAYEKLQDLIKKVTDAGGDEIVLERTDAPTDLGDAQCHVLSPSEWLTEDVNEEQADERYARIHEQCGVLKFGKDTTWVMLPGDADRDAFEKHITDHYGNSLCSAALGAAHHGARTYFRYDEADEPYMDALDNTDPQFVIISAPIRDDSPHGHPHKDAVELYEDKAGTENVLHTGEDRCSYIFDIFRDGGCSEVTSDDGRLADEYGLEADGEDGKGNAGGGARFRRVTPRQKDRGYALA